MQTRLRFSILTSPSATEQLEVYRVGASPEHSRLGSAALTTGQEEHKAGKREFCPVSASSTALSSRALAPQDRSKQ